jgi:hypothetical protein
MVDLGGDRGRRALVDRHRSMVEHCGAGRPIRWDGDMVTLDIRARRLDVDVSDEEMARRRAEWRPRQRALTGWRDATRRWSRRGARG